MTYLQLLSCCLLLFLLLPLRNINALDFDEGFECQWGCKHQNLSHKDGLLTMWLDSSSGSGFKSKSKYKVKYGSGNRIGADIKLDPGPYTAGLSSSDDCAGQHDEVDIEFLGHTDGHPYVFSTNVYVNGYVGDGIDRGKIFNLWFDPSADYHNYAIYWDPTQIKFFVDGIQIRTYPESTSFQLPQGSMRVYGSIWDASSWATDNGRSTANYQRQETFYAYYKNFMINADKSS